ncbi:RHOMBOID-like protein 14 isoform X2 [Wolffia australiana]
MGESHLVYNMMSLLWKGVQLENFMGSLEFAGMVATILALSQGITLLLAKGLLVFFEHETAYYYEYAVGFSGVLFGLKVVLNSQFSDNFTYVHGILVPTRYAAWMELVLIQLFVPGVSFLGHLGGILAGMLYLRLRGSIGRGSDPLSAIFGGAATVFSWPFRLVRRFLRRRPGTSGRGNYVGSNRPGSRGISSGIWRCPACTYNNSAWNNICEMCSTERPGHAFSTHSTPVQPSGISLEELRRRRLDRFDRS